MQAVLGLSDPFFWGLAIAITLLAGFVKGAVGFAMPMIMISGLGSFMAPEHALAGLIIPTVVSNLMQALRGGLASAWQSTWKFRRYVIILLIVIAASAQLVAFLTHAAMFLIVGIPITLISVSQLLGWRPNIQDAHRNLTEVFVATFAGFIGGIAGVWGPPTTAYLTAIETPKVEQIRVQGVIYGTGAIVLFFAHLKSGVLTAPTLQFSALMVVPAIIGMIIGFRLQDGLEQARFRRLTLIVLCIAGLNLIRRGLIA